MFRGRKFFRGRIFRFIVAGILGFLFLWLCFGFLKGSFFVNGANVSSSGYRFVYVQKVTIKAAIISAAEVEFGFHGFGIADLDDKEGQARGGSWRANVFDNRVLEELKQVWGDELIRVEYEELRTAIAGSTNYRILSVQRKGHEPVEEAESLVACR